VLLQHSLTKFRTTPASDGSQLTLVDGANKAPVVSVPFVSRSVM
jgi:hypothetical protein